MRELHRTKRLLITGTILPTLWLFTAGALADNGWPVYRGGPERNQYSPLQQINRKNVKDLTIAWRYDTGEAFRGAQLQYNPIVVDGVIYLTTPRGKVIAADAGTGKPIWQFDPSDGTSKGWRLTRGVVHWSDGQSGRIFFAAGYLLYALDTRSGKPIASFGKAGHIDLREHLDRDPSTQNDVWLGTPGVIYKDLLIVGSGTGELLPAAYGDIRAYDVRTGALRWTFHTIPRPGEYGYDTWPKDAWKHTGSANSWGGLSLDVKRGIVYAPTGSAAYDYYGGDRAGDNLFANSLIALDAKTGKRLWHFQTVHHDIWDRDLPTAPNLVSIMRNGRRIDAVAQPSKIGFLYVFDRVTGKSLFPIEERAVPTDGLPGEVLSPTQPYPLKPEPYSRLEFTEDLITDRTPEARAAVMEKFKKMRSGGQFEPLTEQGTIQTPSSNGGAEWGGAAFDPETGILYINANDVPWYRRMKKREPPSAQTSGRGIYLRECAGCHGPNREGVAPEFPSLVNKGDDLDVSVIFTGRGRMPSFSYRLTWHELSPLLQYVTTGKDTLVEADVKRPPSPYDSEYILAEMGFLQDHEGYPAIKPPWGTLNAIDLSTGDYVWRIPLGEYPELAAKGMKNTGTMSYGGPAVTAGGIVFIGATVHDKKFRAFDKSTGELLWETTLPAAAHATPAIYEAKGCQFVVIASAGGRAAEWSATADASVLDNNPTQYIAFALPQCAARDARKRQ